MPTFTAVGLDRLIEQRATKSMTTVTHSKPDRRNNITNSMVGRGMNTSNSMLERSNSTSMVTTMNNKHHWAQIKPALYITPEPTPLPDSPSSCSPSPYIVNHKRRGPRLMKSFSEDDVAACEQALEEEKVDEISAKVAEKETAVTVPSPVEKQHVNGVCDGELGTNDLDTNLATKNVPAVQNGSMKSVEFNLEEGGELDDFPDPRDSMSAKSNNEGESNGGMERSLYLNTPTAEFFDAWEELCSESGLHPPPCDVEAELREIRLSLLMEIEKRKQAEEALDDMRTHWLRIQEQLSLVGLSLPADPIGASKDEQQLRVDPEEELCRQVYLARFVSNSIGRGTAKAEVEMEMEAQTESKNFEIARLLDRLHYYEAVNREMSQRNQEAIETSRCLSQRRKQRQRWVWGSIAAAIIVGTGALAWSFLSAGRHSSSTIESIAPEHDSAAE